MRTGTTVVFRNFRGAKPLYIGLSLLATAFMLATTSCKKAQQGNEGAGARVAALQQISQTNGIRTPKFPVVADGMLSFESEAHFEQYIAYLDAMIDPAHYDSVRTDEKGDTLEFDQDEILETIESYIGFTSVRKTSHDRFLQLNETGWDRLEDIPEEHFIRDAVMRSVLNNDLTVKIGSNYVHVINKSLSVQVDASKPDLLKTFGEFPEMATLNDVLSIDPLHKHSKLFHTLESGGISTFGGWPTILGAGDLSIINLSHDNPDCNNSKKIVFSNMQLYQDPGPNPPYPPPGGSLPATFIIDFDDNTPTLTIRSESVNSSGSAYVVPPFTHIYANEGTYILKIRANPDWVYGGATSTYAERNYEITVSSTSCQQKEKEGAEQFFVVPDGSRAWSGKISVTKAFHWWSEKTRVIAETSSWIRDGNTWKQSKAEIWHRLHTERRGEGCSVLGQVDGEGWASKSKHITTHRTDNPYRWSKVDTRHGLKYHDQWYYADKSLSVCP